MNTKGIALAGNLIVDVIYPIEATPRPGELTHIFEGISHATGGLVCNTGIDLARLDPNMPIKAMGGIGDDEYGKIVRDTLGECPNIDMSGIVVKEQGTSFTVVMADQKTKVRTFFVYSGANGTYCQDDIDMDNLDCDIFHAGYILLMDTYDDEDPEYGTKLARILHDVQAKGIKTSIDVVSETGDRYKTKVIPSLKYTDYCIINELEAQATTGIMLRDENDKFHPENIKSVLEKLKEYGVSTWACVHCVEGGYGLDENNNYFEVPGLKLPDGYIKGSVGAGDAFCAGVLCGAWKEWPMDKAIELGIASAVCSLSTTSATGGVHTVEEVMKVYNELK